MKILVSACLLGNNCKYNGKNNFNAPLCRLLEGHEIIPVCPEMLGGLGCPRIPCEIQDGKVIGKDGCDYTENFERGSEIAMQIVQKEKPDLAILQKRSPSCGLSQIYDGTFSQKLISDSGKFAQKLKMLDIPILEAESEK